MENFTLSLDELNKLPKNAIALLYLQLSESFSILSAQSQKIQNQNERLIRQIEDLQEQVAILTQQRFGKRTEVDKTSTSTWLALAMACWSILTAGTAW